jgi:hypothetical protein
MLPNLVVDEEGVDTLVVMLVRVLACRTSGGGLRGASGARLVVLGAGDPDDQRPVARRSKEEKERDDDLGGLIEASCAEFGVWIGGLCSTNLELQSRLGQMCSGVDIQEGDFDEAAECSSNKFWRRRRYSSSLHWVIFSA